MRATASPARGALVIRIADAAWRAKPKQRIAGGRERGKAVMNDAPDVAERRV